MGKCVGARFDKSKFGDDAIGLFALGLQFSIEDLDSIGAEIVTGQGDDKKCDLVYFDPEEGRCVVAQCYVSKKVRTSAPANKAADLNTAITWLITTPIDKLPDLLRSRAAEIRDSIKADKLRELNIWYVHNVPESKNVAKELEAVEHTANAAIKGLNPAAHVGVIAREFGDTHFTRLCRKVNLPSSSLIQLGLRCPLDSESTGRAGPPQPGRSGT